MALFAGIPSGVMLVAWDAAAVAGLAVVAATITRRFAPEVPVSRVVVPVLCLAPICFPFAVSMLFGNLDVFFPFLYGLLLVGVVGRSRWSPLRGGAAVAVASITKLHPASLGIWLAVRALRAGPARGALAALVVAGILIVALSLLVGGSGPWSEYLTVVRAGSGADLVDPRNAGPAAQIALLTGAGESFARLLQIPITLVALTITVAAAWRRRDVVESLAWAAAASLITLPVTWFHYPAALMPFALAAVLRSRGAPSAERVSLVIAAALVVSIVAIAALPLLWLAVALVIAAVRASAPPEPGAVDRRDPSPSL
jgi:hypothetical protein